MLARYRAYSNAKPLNTWLLSAFIAFLVVCGVYALLPAAHRNVGLLFLGFVGTFGAGMRELTRQFQDPERQDDGVLRQQETAAGRLSIGFAAANVLTVACLPLFRVVGKLPYPIGFLWAGAFALTSLFALRLGAAIYPHPLGRRAFWASGLSLAVLILFTIAHLYLDKPR